VKKGRSQATSDGPHKKLATFVNEGKNPDYEKAELFYEDSFWAHLGEGQPPQSVNTYEGQIWNIKVNGEITQTFVIGVDEKQQYTI
jgi:hypothetical protein